MTLCDEAEGALWAVPCTVVLCPPLMSHLPINLSFIVGILDSTQDSQSGVCTSVCAKRVCVGAGVCLYLCVYSQVKA